MRSSKYKSNGESIASRSEGVASAYDRATSAVGRKAVKASGVVERAGKAIARLGGALEAASAESLLTHTRNAIRERPLASVSAGFVAGLLFGRLSR